MAKTKPTPKRVIKTKAVRKAQASKMISKKVAKAVKARPVKLIERVFRTRVT